MYSEYNQQDVTFLSLFTSLRRSTCFRRFFRPSSGAQNCIYSVRHLSDQYCYLLLAWTGWNIPSRLAAGSSIGLTLYMQLWAPDDGWKKRLKHVERLTEVNKLRNIAFCWLYSAKLQRLSEYAILAPGITEAVVIWKAPKNLYLMLPDHLLRGWGQILYIMGPVHFYVGSISPGNWVVDCIWNVMAHAQKSDFVFRRNVRVHLNRRGVSSQQ